MKKVGNFKLDVQIMFTALTGSVLYIVGNFYNIGKGILDLIFYSIEKEFFPTTMKKFRIRLSTNTNLYEYYSSSFLRPKTLENETDIEGLLSRTEKK